MSNDTLTTGDRLKQELQRCVERIRKELDRIEILSVAMTVFSMPVPDYEPRFRHLQHATSNAHEFKSR
jgi:hypothetical protein